MFLKNRHLSRMLSVASLAAFSAVHADSAVTDTALTQGTMTISATRSSLAVSDSPRSISVITSEDIADHVGSGGLQSLLEALPGVEFSRSGGLGGQLVTRGFNSNTGRTILAIDGERYRGRSTLQFNMIDPESIERIEVIRGPASALYGSDAMNGVINIVTRRSKSDSEQEFKLSPKLRALQFESGSNMLGGRAELIGGGNGFDVLIGAHHREADDYESPLGTAENSEYSMEGLDFNIGYSPNDDSRWELSGRYENVTTGRAGGLGGAPGAPYVEVTEDPIVERYLRLNYQGEHFGSIADSLDTSLYIRDFETDIYNRNTKSPNATVLAHLKVYSPTVFGGHLTAQKQLGEHNLSYGGDFFHEAFDGRTRMITRYSGDGDLLATVDWHPMERESEQLNVGAYISDDWHINKQWSLSGALRSDFSRVDIGDALASENEVQREAFAGNMSKDYFSVTGNLGGIYRFNPEWHLVANLSRGFRAPSGMNLTVTSVAGTVTTLPSPQLEEETNVTGEVGLRWYGEHTELNVTAYESRYKDLISLAKISEGLYQRQNISDATIRGIELDGSTNLTPKWNIKYALTSTYGNDDSADKPLPHVAPLSGRTSLRYSGQGWYSEAMVRAYKGKSRIDDSQERETDSYVITNLYAGLDLDRVMGASLQGWRLQAGIENLLDVEGRNPAVYEDLNYSNDLVGNPLAEPGRSFMMKLTADY
ncbi:TonB-dependent receptor [Oceanospirillum maris]|uniref:TonB-dependent receptor n=1 Tax=Oceanospirillum maris TaxID=64977 RepID=UPI000406C894|nr:TonB-dependent receptor [Oceanospirillum maris]